MSNNRLTAIFLLLGLLVFSHRAGAEIATTTPAAEPSAQSDVRPAVPPVPVVVAEPLTVADVSVDKTDASAVTAREQALLEARRIAFQKLAERFMTPDVFKNLQLPEDALLAAFVQDLEIKQEKISANRYAASFTVRFNEEAAKHIRSAGGTIADVATAPAPGVAAAAAPPAKTILILPYFENIAGKKVLWEDPNAWREAWQTLGNTHLPSGTTITVPLGDVADISTGSTDAVWAGDYTTLEMLRDKYSAQEIILTVANKSGINVYVSVYLYKDGRLERQNSLMPYSGGEDDKDIFRKAIGQVVKNIQELKPYHEAEISPADAAFKELTTPLKQVEASVPPAPPPVPEKLVLRVGASFTSFTQWLEVQKRLVSLSPPVTVEISSLSKNSAQFTMTTELVGGIDAFTKSVAGRGMTLSAVEGGDPQKPLYALKLN